MLVTLFLLVAVAAAEPAKPCKAAPISSWLKPKAAPVPAPRPVATTPAPPLPEAKAAPKRSTSAYDLKKADCLKKKRKA